eukprot:2974815-Alexandrium_andersonii.AAC.1
MLEAELNVDQSSRRSLAQHMNISLRYRMKWSHAVTNSLSVGHGWRWHTDGAYMVHGIASTGSRGPHTDALEKTEGGHR